MRCLKKLKIILLFSLILCIFISYKIQNNYRIPVKDNLAGVVVDYKIDGSKLTLEIKAKNRYIANYYFKTKLEKEDLSKKVKLGYYVKLKGSFKNPSVNRNFNLFNYKNYLKSKKIYYIFDIDNIEISKKETLKFNLKNTILARIEKSKNADYLKLFILGENDLDSNIKDSYRTNGISHLFAISGMHITLFTTFLLFLLNKKAKNKVFNFIVVCLFLYVYMFLVNYTPSVIRASSFFMILNVKKFLKLPFSNLELIVFLLLLLLIYNPFYIYNIGFIYSFTISITLIYFSNNLKNKNYFKTLFMTSLISFLISLPINIQNNFEVNLLTPLINLIFVPFISFVVFPLSLINFIFPPIDQIYGGVLNILEFVSLSISNIKFLNIILCNVSIYIFIFYYLFIIFVIRKITFKKLFILIIILIIHSNIKYLNNYPIVTMIDVGQGDSILIELPHNKGNILVDTGGIVSYNNELWQMRKNKYSIANSTTIPYLKSIGVKRIDYLILTHGDFDHLGEAINLINNFKVKYVLFNSGYDNDNELIIKELLDERNIKYKSIDKYNLKIDNYPFKFLNKKNTDNENEDSLVFEVKLNDYKLLFMGDAGKVTEEKLVDEYNISNVDILKVGHHGSKNSSSDNFIKVIKPKYAIISAGVNNRFNHPNVETIDILKKYKSKIYVTNELGMIRMTLKNKIEVKTVLGR